MTSISISDVLTLIYVLVDDWYQGQPCMRGKCGARAEFSDSEMLTLMLAQEFIPYPSETQFVAYMRANHQALFPRLLTQSQFNRRARGLREKIELFRREVIGHLGVTQERDFLLDTKPVPVMGYKRRKAHSDFLGSASYGVCASRNLKYFGYKLVMLVTLAGIPAVYDLVPANLDERLAAEAVLFHAQGCDIVGDKGFIGTDWQAQIKQHTANHLYTPKRANQFPQNPPEFERWLNGVRERIEGTFHEIQNTGRNLERLLAKTIVGLCTRVSAKLASHALRLWLRRTFQIDIQTFQIRPL
jgi:hypothetical protein